MDLVLLLSLLAGIIIILVILTIFRKKVEKGPDQEVNPQRAAQVAPGARRRVLAGNRNVRGRQRIAAEENDVDNDGDQGEEPALDLPEGKVGAKKMAKLQAKAEKKAMREAEEKSREEKKRAQELADEQRRIQEEKEKEEERKREEKERKEREEKERQEYEEYLKLKEAFSVQEEGFEEGEDETESSLLDFLNYIKDNKVVVLEDIAAKYKLKTQSAIDRIQQLQADGVLTGVIDDRGKFIFISEKELGAVAKFVKQRGRVSIAELVDNSNRLINLMPKIEVAS